MKTLHQMTPAEVAKNREWMQAHYNAWQDARRERRTDDACYHRDCWLECRMRDDQAVAVMTRELRAAIAKARGESR